MTAMVLTIVMIFTVSTLCLQITTYADGSGSIQLSIYSMHGNGSSASSAGLDLGHAWLVVENETDNDYSFYNTTLSSGETVSIGTWGNVIDLDTGSLYQGAWLNLEAQAELGTQNTASLTITITSQQLSAVSQKCIQMNAWDLFNNCSYFASTIWNSVAPSDMQVNSYFFPANFPATLKDSIQNIDGHENNRSFAYNDYTGYCTNSTTFKYVAPENYTLSSGRSINNYTSFPEEYSRMTMTELRREMAKYYSGEIIRRNENG